LAITVAHGKRRIPAAVEGCEVHGGRPCWRSGGEPPTIAARHPRLNPSVAEAMPDPIAALAKYAPSPFAEVAALARSQS
ncbi:MAG: hypothetical protein ACRD1R_05390, partial [Acidobacteriota bacterium]